jgi:hypothetical protein
MKGGAWERRETSGGALSESMERGHLPGDTTRQRDLSVCSRGPAEAMNARHCIVTCSRDGCSRGVHIYPQLKAGQLCKLNH